MPHKKANLIDLMGTSVDKQVSSVFKRIGKAGEFEVMFFNIAPDSHMSMEKFLKMLEFLKARFRASKGKMQLNNYQLLDISYLPERKKEDDTLTSYRLSVSGIDSINRYMRMFHQRKNHVIFKGILAKLKEDTNLSLMKKVKVMDNIVDVSDLDIRFRLSDELDVTREELEMLENIAENTRNNISYRYKERISLVLESTSDYQIQIDLTTVKTHRDINSIERDIPRYELELEFVPKKKTAPEHLKRIYDETQILLKVLQQSNEVITRAETDAVMFTYKSRLGLEGSMHSLYGRHPHSLEIQHVTDSIPNKYTVTDKADGERYGLVVNDNHVYLISGTMDVKATGLDIGEKLGKKYNGTILDGELIFIPRKNRYLYMVFDCLFLGEDDERDTQSFLDRLDRVDEIVNDCFILKGQKGFKPKKYTGSFDDSKIKQFHEKQIIEMMKNLNHDIDVEQRYPLIRRKYFIPSLGGKPNEIFKYTQLLWTLYTNSNKVTCPYTLDGTVYHPLEQKYVTSVRESEKHDYKWKPEDKNSIDFYITFLRDDEGQTITTFDNSVSEEMEGRPYRACYLHVGRVNKSGEQPILFQKDSGKYIAYLFLDRGEVRDLDGRIIQDKTVVEFYYNNDLEINDKLRWVPIRTRYDKTETMLRHKRKFGNYVDVANRVWRSIANPILMKDFAILAKDDMYTVYQDKLRSKIDHSLILSEQKENMYYQEKKDLALPMRNFHNFIKSNMIYTYCSPNYNGNKKLSILDIACGKGGDLAKFHYARVSHYVGVDIDNAGLIAATDGALSRYRLFRKKYTNFPQMHFAHADAGSLFDYESQLKSIGSMSATNRKLLDQFFSKEKPQRFDAINMQFALHYLLRDQTTWDNFCTNIYRHLNIGGYALFTTFDAHKVMESLDGKDKFSTHYTDKKGVKRLMFELVKQFKSEPEDGTYGLGYAIDVHNGIYMQEGNYATEYLVDPDFLIKEFAERCGMVVVETDLFERLFCQHEHDFKNVVPKEENPKTRKFLTNAGAFYDLKDEINKASYQMTRLNRFYVFKRVADKNATVMGQVNNPFSEKKVNKSAPEKPTKKPVKKSAQKPAKKPTAKPAKKPSKSTKKTGKQKGGGDGTITAVDDQLRYRKNESGDKSLVGSVLSNLQTAGLVPASVTVKEFAHDVGVEIPEDDQMKMDDIKRLCSLEVNHTREDSDSVNVLKGINILVLKKDCDGEYGDGDITLYSKTKKGWSKRSNTMILTYSDEDGFQPVIRLEDDNEVAIFKNSHSVVKNLLKQV